MLYLSVCLIAWVGTVQAVPTDFECAWRTSAMSYARTLQPHLTVTQQGVLSASLSIHGCIITGEGTIRHPRPAAAAAGRRPVGGTPTYYVAATADGGATCSDVAAGTSLAQPLCSVEAAVLRCRTVVAECIVVLRGGKHILNRTIALTPTDSHLTLQAYPNETPTITGALPLPHLQWQKVSSSNSSDSGGGDSNGSSSYAAPDKCTLYNNTDIGHGHDLPGGPFKASDRVLLTSAFYVGQV
jgi:hypothetical protein